MQADPPTHVVSQSYSLLLNASTPELPSYARAWEVELWHSTSFVDWQKCFILTHKLSLATKKQEKKKELKLVTRWYRCPSTIHQYNLTLPDTC